MSILKKWIREFLSLFVFLRFKNIWNLYDWLLERKKTRGLHASVFIHYVDRQGGYIGIGAVFGNRPYLPHGLHGVFISDHAVIGKNAVIFQDVTIGSVRTRGSRSFGSPVIGDNCYIGAGAKIIGNVHVGNNCRIGANAVVYKDMPDNSTATCAATVIRVSDTAYDNRFIAVDLDGTESFWNGSGFEKCSDQ